MALQPGLTDLNWCMSPRRRTIWTILQLEGGLECRLAWRLTDQMVYVPLMEVVSKNLEVGGRREEQKFCLMHKGVWGVDLVVLQQQRGANMLSSGGVLGSALRPLRSRASMSYVCGFLIVLGVGEQGLSLIPSPSPRDRG